MLFIFLVVALYFTELPFNLSGNTLQYAHYGIKIFNGYILGITYKTAKNLRFNEKKRREMFIYILYLCKCSLIIYSRSIGGISSWDLDGYEKNPLRALLLCE